MIKKPQTGIYAPIVERIKGIEMHKNIEWPEFKFPPVNLWVMPRLP